MKRRTAVFLLWAACVSGCDASNGNPPDAEASNEKHAVARKLQEACGSNRTFDRLKALAFDDAVKIRKAESPTLENIAAYAVVRMEDPVVKSHDEKLNVTVCSGHFVLELPPGAEDVFDGDRRLEADVEYAAQTAADGSGLVYQMQGAEPIVYRLAAIDLQSGKRPAGRPGAPETRTTEDAAAPSLTHEVKPSETRRSSNIARPLEPAAPSTEEVRAQAPVQEGRQLQSSEQPRAPGRPSFNCRYARSEVEKMICSTAQLAEQDRAMSSAFYAALAKASRSQRAALRASRDRFLESRDRCDSVSCVSQSYEDRMDEIRAIGTR